jgi:hypothetical protein
MFNIETHAEMTAVFRAILEAKFHPTVVDADVPGSELLANVAVRMRDALIDIEQQRDGSIAERRWKEWRSISPARREWSVAVEYAVEMWRGVWQGWLGDQRIHAAKCLLSPFEPEDATLNKFLQVVEERMKDQT